MLPSPVTNDITTHYPSPTPHHPAALLPAAHCLPRITCYPSPTPHHFAALLPQLRAAKDWGGEGFMWIWLILFALIRSIAGVSAFISSTIILNSLIGSGLHQRSLSFSAHYR